MTLFMAAKSFFTIFSTKKETILLSKSNLSKGLLLLDDIKTVDNLQSLALPPEEIPTCAIRSNIKYARDSIVKDSKIKAIQLNSRKFQLLYEIKFKTKYKSKLQENL